MVGCLQDGVEGFGIKRENINIQADRFVRFTTSRKMLMRMTIHCTLQILSKCDVCQVLGMSK